jgi:hypothetical protein
MITAETRSHEAQLEALKELAASEGWAIYQEHVAQAWGAEECLEQIDKALVGASPEEELAITKRIRDTFKGVRAEATWVSRRITALEAIVKEQRKPALVDRFAGLRRVPR